MCGAGRSLWPKTMPSCFRHGRVTARIRSSEHARSASVRLRAEVWVNWRGVLGVPRCWVCRGWWAEVGAEVHGRTARLGPFHLLCTCGGLSKRAASTYLPLSAVKYEQGCGPAPHCRWDACDTAAARRTHVNTAARQASGISAYSEGGRTRAEPLPVLSMAWLPRDLVVESRGSKSMR